jgi:hypothetical protein
LIITNTHLSILYLSLSFRSVELCININEAVLVESNVNDAIRASRYFY